jgi:hypothetical protein
MILGNGRAIFHEKRAKRSRQGDSNPRRRKYRATGDSRGAGPIPGSRGKPRFTRVGRGSGSAGQPELQGLRIGEPDATGNRGGHGTERQGQSTGQPGLRLAEPGRRGQRATEVHVQPETGRRQQRETGVASGSTNLRWYRATGVTDESGNEFQGAPGDRSFHETLGNRCFEKSAGNCRFQPTAERLAQGNGGGTRTGSGSASSQALCDDDIGKLSSGSRSQVFEEFGQKGARSRKGSRPLRFSTRSRARRFWLNNSRGFHPKYEWRRESDLTAAIPVAACVGDFSLVKSRNHGA